MKFMANIMLYLVFFLGKMQLYAQPISINGVAIGEKITLPICQGDRKKMFEAQESHWFLLKDVKETCYVASNSWHKNKYNFETDLVLIAYPQNNMPEHAKSSIVYGQINRYGYLVQAIVETDRINHNSLVIKELSHQFGPAETIKTLTEENSFQANDGSLFADWVISNKAYIRVVGSMWGSWGGYNNDGSITYISWNTAQNNQLVNTPQNASLFTQGTNKLHPYRHFKMRQEHRLLHRSAVYDLK